MDLYRINLNLLVALDALLSEQNVTRAAKKLFITQAAMSNNLQQLRALFKDELLIREKRRMIMTYNAKLLQPKIHKIIQEVSCVISHGQFFNPETSNRVFQIGMSDYFTLNVLPKIMNSVRQQAPNIKIVVHAMNYIDDTTPLESGKCDLAIGRMIKKNSSAIHHLLFKDEPVCIMNPKHALAHKKKITLEDYLSQKHITVSTNNVQSAIEDALALIGKKRDIQLVLPYFGPILKIIEQSDTLTATLPKNMACLYYNNHYDFVSKSLPFEVAPIEYYMAWHSGATHDLGHLWLRTLITKTFKRCIRQI